MSIIYRKKIQITGIVQGVGFRPYIYHLAKRNLITGFVCNNRAGVLIEAQGTTNCLDRFILQISETPPPLSQILNVDVVGDISIVDTETKFIIKDSDMLSDESTLISPDQNVCPKCIDELFTPENRRFEYPFINCTECGPRYSISHLTPFDRAFTSMSSFEQCPECLSEYEVPENRRFHAQANGCKKCGPKLTLLDSEGNVDNTENPIHAAIIRLKMGKILAVKGIGGYHLVCDAVNESAVQKLRKRKLRRDKPFAIMVPSLFLATDLCHVNPVEEKLILSKERPIVLLKKRDHITIAPSIAPYNNVLGIMLPYTPIHYLLFGFGLARNAEPFLSTTKIPKQSYNFHSLVMTSGNISDEPIVFDDKEALKKLNGIADGFLTHNRQIVWGSDDSIINATPANNDREKSIVIRRSRGFIPAPFYIEKRVPQILACGGDLKNSFCLSSGKHLFPGPHCGDLENAEAFNLFRDSVEHYKQIFRLKPEFIVVDKHPGYFSSRYGMGIGLPVIMVQHHHAHIVAVKAEHGLKEPSIGIALDGSGYGDDGTIWGSEIAIVTDNEFVRKGHFKPLVLPGGDIASKEPWRMAISLLYQIFGSKCYEIHPKFIARIGEEKFTQIVKVIESNINCPNSSGAGRLFDAVASLLDIQHYNFFEGHAPMKLEALADISHERTLGYQIDKNGEISFHSMIYEIIDLIYSGITIEKISGLFHNTIAHALNAFCERLKKINNLKNVILSGGVFQNMVLLNLLRSMLVENGFNVFYPSKFPINDGGLAIGQIDVALRKIESESKQP